MKANGAPKKIYLEWYRIGDKKYRDWCIIPKTNDKSVEYTRTDAFIEKACDYLSYHLDTSKIGVNYKFDFIEEFRNAMKL